MLLWVKLLIGITLAVGAQNEGHPSQSEPTEPPPDFVDHDSKCFNVKPEVCTSPFPDRCNCKKIDDHSVVCCNITKSTELNSGLKCADFRQSNVRFMHLRNATLQDLHFLTNDLWPRLETFSINEGRIEGLTSVPHENLTCLNISSNAILELNEEAFKVKLPNLKILDLSNNDLIKLPKFRNRSISLDISDNRGVECQTLLQFVTDYPLVNFLNGDSTYCVSSKTFQWFNSTELVPVSQILILRNIEQNCTKGCTCKSYRMDMVTGKHPTVSVMVDCSSIGLTRLPEYLPTNTISLNVSNNNITTLDPLTFDASYEDIREFYADSNQISSILSLEGSKFIDNFLVLSLKKNYIKSLPTYILSNTFDRNLYNDRRVTLGGNKLICNCSVALYVKVWLLSNKKHIPDYDQVLCENTGEKVIALDQNKICVYERDWTDYIYYIIAGEVGLLLLLVGKVSYDYWVFKTAGYLPWPASKMPKLPCDWVLE